MLKMTRVKKAISILVILTLMFSVMSFVAAETTEPVEPTEGSGVTEEVSVTNAVYDESGAWVTTVEEATWTTVPGGVTLTGSDATGAYASEQFKNEAFEFIFNAPTEDAWPAITLRMDNYNDAIWGANEGYLIAFKSDVIEFQRFGGLNAEGTMYETVQNDGIVVSGQDHKIRVSAVDAADGVRLRVSVDGIQIFDHVDTTPVWDAGYFGLYAMAGKPLTIKNFRVIEETRTGDWVTSVEGATLTAVPSGVTLLGSDATAAYEKQQYKNGTFEFTLNAQTEDAWPAITMRMSNYDHAIWSGNQGYLVAFKPDVIEFQRFGGETSTSMYETVDNTGIFNSGQDHQVRVSTVDTATGVRLTVAVDGVTIFDKVDTSPVWDAGYFGLYAMAGKPLTIKNFVPREEQHVNGWVTSTNGATLTPTPGGVTLLGSDAIAANSEQKFKNETFNFTFNAQTEDAWPAFTMRMKSYDTPIWSNEGYLVAFKPDIIEFQRFGGTTAGSMYEKIDNTGIFNSGQDHQIQASVVDTADGVLMTVNVDGVKIFEHLDTEPVLSEGYFGLYAMAGKPASISNFKFGSASDAYTKGPLEPLLFTDVSPDHAEYDSIHFLAYTQVISNEEIAFNPDQAIKLGSFIEMAVKAMCNTVDQPCEDLAEGTPMEMALEAGLVLDGEFTDLEQAATVANMQQILDRAFVYSGIAAEESVQLAAALIGHETSGTLTRAEAAQLLMRFIHVY